MLFYFPVDSPVQYFPEQAQICLNFAKICSWYLMERFLTGAPLCAPQGKLSLKTPVLLEFITKLKWKL